MNPEIKAKWVAALRSGEYRQTTKVLTTGESHCCLGVLCDLFARTHGIEQWDSQSLGAKGDEVPNQEVCKWAGFPEHDNPMFDNDPTVWIGDLNRGLSTHNDAGHTFSEIADAIEQQL